jgi:Nif-specific regulatory protein
VRVNCAALNENLFESELFGHEKGAFTGATARRIGRLEEAHGGTLFLDEIGEISPAMQAKLLRVLQEREYERVGGNETLTADVRIIAATTATSKKRCAPAPSAPISTTASTSFPSSFPAARTHQRHRRVGQPLRSEIRQSDDQTAAAAGGGDAPAPDAPHLAGNVRELENCIEYAVLICSGPLVLPDHLPQTLRTSTFAPVASPTTPRGKPASARWNRPSCSKR